MSSSFFLSDRASRGNRQSPGNRKKLSATPGRFYRPEPTTTTFKRRSTDSDNWKAKFSPGGRIFQNGDASDDKEVSERGKTKPKPSNFFLPERGEKVKVRTTDQIDGNLSRTRCRPENPDSVEDNLATKSDPVDVEQTDRLVKRKRGAVKIKTKKRARLLKECPTSPQRNAVAKRPTSPKSVSPNVVRAAPKPAVDSSSDSESADPFDALQAGAKVEAVITSVSATGILVEIHQLGELVLGRIPDFLVSDIFGTHWMETRKPKQILTCRVVFKNKNHRSVLLTSKPSIVCESAETILSARQDAITGLVVRGWVTECRPTETTISFYNGITGIAKWSPGKVLSKKFRLKPGQTVTCTVAKSDDGDSTDIRLTDIESSIKAADSSAGKIGSYRVTAILDSGLVVEAIAESGSTECFLPMEHLSDHPSLCPLWLKTFRVGEIIDQALCFSTGAPMIVTVKPALVEWVASGKSTLRRGWAVGSVIPCVFEGGLRGRLLNNASTRIVVATDAKSVAKCDYVTGQTLITTILKRFSGGRFCVSVASSATGADSHNWSLKFLKNFVDEREEIVCRRIMLQALQRTGAHTIQTMIPLGSVVELNSIWELDNNIYGRLSGAKAESFLCVKPPAADLTGLLESNNVRAVALELTVSNSNGVLLCIQPDVVKYFDSPTRAETPMSTGSVIQCRVLISNPDYVLGICRPCPDVSLVYIPAKKHPNQLWKDVQLPEVGKICCIQITSVTDQYIFGVRVSIKEFKEWKNRSSPSVTL